MTSPTWRRSRRPRWEKNDRCRPSILSSNGISRPDLVKWQLVIGAINPRPISEQCGVAPAGRLDSVGSPRRERFVPKIDAHVKRIYANAERSDGRRILVDRLWPRGMTRENAKVDLWLKEIAPSNELRKWFGHDTAKWPEFKRKYLEELKGLSGPLATLRHEARENTITLLYAARDEEHNEAVILLEFLRQND
jgi:uncharacterized protein YeaO (DUF488 family)